MFTPYIADPFPFAFLGAKANVCILWFLQITMSFLSRSFTVLMIYTTIYIFWIMIVFVVVGFLLIRSRKRTLQQTRIWCMQTSIIRKITRKGIFIMGWAELETLAEKNWWNLFYLKPRWGLINKKITSRMVTKMVDGDGEKGERRQMNKMCERGRIANFLAMSAKCKHSRA